MYALEKFKGGLEKDVEKREAMSVHFVSRQFSLQFWGRTE